MFGYGGHPDWRDMSEYVVHLTAFEPMREILNQRVLKQCLLAKVDHDARESERRLTSLIVAGPSWRVP